MRVRLFGTLVGLVGLSTALMGVVPAGAGASGSDKTFCKAVVKISLFFNTIEEEPSEKQLARIEELLEPVEENAPADIAEAVDTAVAGVRSGDFESDEVGEAGNTVDQWVVDNCGYEVVQVTARDYEFEGIPETLKTGTVLFEFTNEGAELHEIGVVRIKGDESVEEVLELPEDEAEGKIQEVGFGFAAPGETSVAYLKLKKPGTYGAACFIPVGSTSFEEAETADGPPHFTEGMFAEFEVEK
jgi:hypothetical protein